jgi:hypothetical protein
MPEDFNPSVVESTIEAGLALASANPGRWVRLAERMVPAVATHIKLGNYNGRRGEYDAVIGDGGGNRADIYVRHVRLAEGEDSPGRGQGRGQQ